MSNHTVQCPFVLKKVLTVYKFAPGAMQKWFTVNALSLSPFCSGSL